MLIAFDYSMSCPAMTISYRPDWQHSECYWLTDVKKYQMVRFIDGAVLNGCEHFDYKTQEERFDNISQHFIMILEAQQIPANTLVYIEDYSMGSKGRVFHIAECTGLMKYKLWRRGHDIVCVAPTVIKKHATGKGTATKEAMYAAFVKQTGISLATVMEANSAKIGSPIADIVDSWFLAQLGHTLTPRVKAGMIETQIHTLPNITNEALTQ